MKNHKPRSFSVALAMLGLGLLQPPPTWCTIPISVLPKTSPVVQEFDDGQVKFVITDTANVNVTIDSITIGDPSIQFVDDDALDEVFDTGVVVVPFPCPFVLHPLSDKGFVHSCTFVQTFDTQDLFPRLSDDDQGQWYIYNDVGFTVNAAGGHATGRALVTVTDTPEPSSIVLASLGSVLIFLWKTSRA